MGDKRRVAVITDTVSAGFYFPLWHKYYSSHVGADNIFVVSYGASLNEFENYTLGGLWRIRTFNNKVRCESIASLCSLLLSEYDYVIRVDTDEFIVPDPKLYASLAEYIQQLQRPYVTASGYNVIAQPDQKSLIMNVPVLSQRRSCYPYDALNKTCVLGVPVRWAPGFHFASVYPEFDGLSLFHLKYADIDMQLAIGAAVAGQSDEALFQDYHRTSRDKLVAMINSIQGFERGAGWDQFDRPKYRAKFLDGVQYITGYGGVYHGSPFGPERILLEIPNEFLNAF
jgi:hypothetical protein